MEEAAITAAASVFGVIVGGLIVVFGDRSLARRGETRRALVAARVIHHELLVCFSSVAAGGPWDETPPEEWEENQRFPLDPEDQLPTRAWTAYQAEVARQLDADGWMKVTLAYSAIEMVNESVSTTGRLFPKVRALNPEWLDAVAEDIGRAMGPLRPLGELSEEREAEGEDAPALGA